MWALAIGNRAIVRESLGSLAESSGDNDTAAQWFESALEDYTRALSLFSSDMSRATVLENRSDLLRKLEDDRSDGELNRAIAIGPTRASGYARRALWRLSAGDVEGAQADVAAAESLAHTHNDRCAAKWARACLSAAKNIGDGLEALLDDLVEKCGSDPAREWRAKVRRDNGNLTDALADFEELDASLTTQGHADTLARPS